MHDLRSIFFNQAARAAAHKEDEDLSINEEWEKEKKTLVSNVNILLDGTIQEFVFEEKKKKLHNVIRLGPRVNKRSQSTPIKINAVFST